MLTCLLGIGASDDDVSMNPPFVCSDRRAEPLCVPHLCCRVAASTARPPVCSTVDVVVARFGRSLADDLRVFVAVVVLEHASRPPVRSSIDQLAGVALDRFQVVLRVLDDGNIPNSLFTGFSILFHNDKLCVDVRCARSCLIVVLPHRPGVRDRGGGGGSASIGRVGVQ
jgi:hypothetical protein